MKKLFTLACAFGISLFGFSQTFLSEDFSTFSNDSIPPLASGWKNIDSSATLNGQTWRFLNPGSRTLNAPISHPAAILDSDNYGSGSSQDAYLISPNFDASLATVVTLEFDQFYRVCCGSTADVEVFDGSTWTSVYSLTSTTSPDPEHVVVNISSLVAGVTNAQIRFHYVGSWDYYWILDNITVFQPTPDDIKAIAVDSLVNGCGLSNETIALRITNVGSTPVSNIPLQYELNGGVPVSETYAGTLNPGDTIVYSFTTLANMSTPGAYNITAYSAVRGDANPVNDTARGVMIHKVTYNSFPYYEDFEASNGGWTTGGSASSWAYGTPAASVINSAASGTKAWATNLTGNYNASEASYVIAPCFDFTSLAAPQFKMKVWWNSESGWDGAALQSSIDNGMTWQNVGAFGDPNNWYNDNSISGLTTAISSNQEGWSGRNSTGSGGWVLAEHDLTGLGGQSSVQLRIVFGADPSIMDEGFAFDDVLIQDAPASDLGVLRIDAPTSGCGLGSADSVRICFTNAGSTVVRNFPLSYTLNGGTAVTETFNDSIQPGDTLCFTFNTTVNLSTIGNYNIKAYSSLTGDGNFLNDTTTKTIVNIPILNSYPYSQDFESGNGGWTSGGANSSWALGTPANTVINSAASGTQAWVTNLTGPYNASEQSYVVGPCFDFTNLAAPQFKMKVWWNSEFSWDGAVLQSSIDGGTTWQNVGAFGDPNNWYNDNSINGLANFVNPQDGWSGRVSSSNGSGGWVLAEHDLTGLGGVSGVLLRIAFGADASVMDEGFAFDDVLIMNAPANDAGVVSLVNPGSNCGLSTTDTVKISIVNFGSATIDSIPVGYSMNGGTPVLEMHIDSIQPGDTSIYVFQTATVNLSVPGSYTFDAWASLPNDGNPMNDTLFNRVVNNNMKNAPYLETFDSFQTGTSNPLLNGWTRTTTSTATIGYNWYANSGQTGSANTGPTGDHTSGSGKYLYTEASYGSLGDLTMLTSPCINPGAAAGMTLDFWYHMFGTEINTLYIEVGNNSGYTKVDSIVGSQQTAIADPFRKRSINITSFLGNGNISVRFSSVTLGCCAGDIAIDDFKVYEPQSNDVGVLYLESPLTACGLGVADSVKICFKNYGLVAASNFPVTYVVNGGTPVTETFSGTIQPGDTACYTFNTTVNVSAPGTYNFDSYTSLVGDGDATNDTIKNVEVLNTLVLAPITIDFNNLTSGQFGAFTNGWTGTSTSTFRWQSQSGATSSSNTGPSGDASGSGLYVYTEASSGIAGDIAWLTSPCVELNTTIIPAMIYKYHMFGATIDRLNIQIDNGSGFVTIDSIIGQQQTALTDPWRADTIDLSAYKNGNQASIRFEVIRGSSFTGDVSIDDVQLYDKSNNVLETANQLNGITVYPNPSNGVFNINIPSDSKYLRLEVTDISGKVVQEAFINKASNSIYKLDLSKLSKGIYLMKVSDNNYSKSEKLIIK